MGNQSPAVYPDPSLWLKDETILNQEAHEKHEEKFEE